VLIKDSGGLRKVRWKLEGRGKSGGIRAIYYWMVSDDQIYMVYAYPKAKQENLTPEQVAALKKLYRGGMMNEEMFNELLASVQEVDAIIAGDKKPSREFHFDEPQVK
jgi:hypothetical protein